MKLSKHLTPCSSKAADWKSCRCYGCVETRATIEQGINEILLECERIHLPVELLQTGGMCMAVNVELPNGTHDLMLTEGGLGLYKRGECEQLAFEWQFAGHDAKTEKGRAKALAEYASRIYWQSQGYTRAVANLQQEEFTEHATILKQLEFEVQPNN